MTETSEYEYELFFDLKYAVASEIRLIHRRQKAVIVLLLLLVNIKLIETLPWVILPS